MTDKETAVVGPTEVAFLTFLVGGFVLRFLVPEEAMPYGWAGDAAVLVAASGIAYVVAKRLMPRPGFTVQKRVWRPVMLGLIALAVAGLLFIVAFTAALPSV